MKQIILLALCLMCFAGTASAYQVNIDAPESLSMGQPLIVNGTTTLGIGTPIDVVLYSQITTSTEIQRNVVYVQSDKTFKTIFDTSNLKNGMYKIEVPVKELESPSTTLRLVRILGSSIETPIPTTVPTTLYRGEPKQVGPSSSETPVVRIVGTPAPTPTITTGQTTIVTTIPTPVATIVQTTSLTTTPTTSQTTIKTPTPTPTPNYDAKIAALESQLAVQNQKIEEQGNILDKITSFLRNIFGWK